MDKALVMIQSLSRTFTKMFAFRAQWLMEIVLNNGGLARLPFVQFMKQSGNYYLVFVSFYFLFFSKL